MRLVPRVPPFDREATYEDLKKIPDTMVAEMAGGELYAFPRPALPHASVATSISASLLAPYHFGRSGPGGWLILFEPELHFGRDVLVPDYAGWRRTRLPAVRNEPWLTLAPDWACELLSPTTAVFDRTRKLEIYAREDVSHMWLIDPATRTLEVLGLEGRRWTILGVHAGDKVVRAEPFTEIELDLASFWADLADPPSGVRY
jgi:Uma2 family endonuclease